MRGRVTHVVSSRVGMFLFADSECGENGTERSHHQNEQTRVVFSIIDIIEQDTEAKGDIFLRPPQSLSTWLNSFLGRGMIKAKIVAKATVFR